MNIIQLFDKDRDHHKISELIIKNGSKRSLLEEKTIDIESYYMSLMGENGDMGVKLEEE